MSDQVYFNPWDESFRANPYPHYKALYGRPPHLLNMFFQMALVARYDDAVTILHDHAHFSSAALADRGVTAARNYRIR